MAPRPPPRPPTGYHADFIRRFTERESKRRIAKRPKTLTDVQHAALREQLKEVHFLKPDHSDNTKINIACILRKWKRYCEKAKLVGSWMEVIQRADRAMSMDFLLHLCEEWKIRSWGTSWEYFRQYKQLYASATGRYMDRNDSREVLKWHDAVLVARFDLQPPNSRGKGVADSGALLALLTFNIAFDTGIFPTERHRVQLAGCYIGLACTGARAAEFVDNERKQPKDGCWEELYGPRAILAASDGDLKGEDKKLDDDSRVLEELLSEETTGRGRPKALCYEDILLMVVRHPETGEDVLAMSIKFIHHKGADNKPKPTIFFFTPTRRLIFCFISVIVSLAIADGAFRAPSLTTPRRVFEVKNRGPVKCTPLRWKEEWLKRPVFRRFEGTVVSEDEALQYHKLNDDMARQSLDSGCETPMQPKDFRRGAANVANGDAPDAVRDQMMRHDPKWATFNSAYINENVQYHLQNAFLDEPTEDSMIGMLSHIGLTRDPRASKNMVPDEVWDYLEPDPEIVALEAERELLKGGQYRIKGTENEHRIRELGRLISTKKKQRKKTVRKEYREDYFDNRPTWDIERQAAGIDLEDDDGDIKAVIDIQIPERAELAEIQHTQLEDLSSTQLLELRIRASELMVALCRKRETVKRDCVQRRAPTNVIIKEESPPPNPFPLLMDRRQCPRCIGDDELSYGERTFKYCRPAVMYDHFDKQHAQVLHKAELISCNHPLCVEEARRLVRSNHFRDLNHFKNHVESVHGVKLRYTRV